MYFLYEKKITKILLQTRFMSISQLNKDLERMSTSLKQFEKEKMLFESFLTKVSLLIKDGSITFIDSETV